MTQTVQQAMQVPVPTKHERELLENYSSARIQWLEECIEHCEYSFEDFQEDHWSKEEQEELSVLRENFLDKNDCWYEYEIIDSLVHKFKDVSGKSGFVTLNL